MKYSVWVIYAVKPFLSAYSKIDKTKILMTNGSLMKFESILDCSRNTFDLHEAIIGLENQFLILLRVAVSDKFYCEWAHVHAYQTPTKRSNAQHLVGY